jgi:hypothetical protein
VGSIRKLCITNKIDIKVYIGKNGSSKLLILLGIPTWGVGSTPPNVMTKLKKDNDFVDLIQASKVSYTKGLKMFKIVEMDEIFNQKGTQEGDHFSCSLS